jgi:hypothetical protein
MSEEASTIQRATRSASGFAIVTTRFVWYVHFCAA